MAYEVIMGLSASYAIVFVGTFTEYPFLPCKIEWQSVILNFSSFQRLCIE